MRERKKDYRSTNELLRCEGLNLFTELIERGVAVSVISCRAKLEEDNIRSKFIYSVVASRYDSKKLIGLGFVNCKEKEVRKHNLIEKELCEEEVGAFRMHKDAFNLVANEPFGKVWELKGKSLTDRLEIENPCSPENILGYV